MTIVILDFCGYCVRAIVEIAIAIPIFDFVSVCEREREREGERERERERERKYGNTRSLQTCGWVSQAWRHRPGVSAPRVRKVEPSPDVRSIKTSH